MDHSKKKQVSRNEEGGWTLKLLCILCIASVLVMLFRYPVWNPNTAEESFIAGSYEGIIEPSTTFHDVKVLNEAKAQFKVYYARFLLYKRNQVSSPLKQPFIHEVKKKQPQFKQLNKMSTRYYLTSRKLGGARGYVGISCKVPDAEGSKNIAHLKDFELFLTDTMEQDGIKDEFYVLKCPTCVPENEEFGSVKKFMKHQNDFHITFKYSCPQCGARLPSEQKRDQHLSAGHGISTPKEQEVFECPNH